MGQSGFRISTQLRGDDEALLVVAGSVDRRGAQRVTTVLRALLDAGARQILVDLAHVHDCDPALTVHLDRERKRMRALGGWLVVDGSPATMRHDTTTLGEIFRVYQRVRATVAAPLPEAARMLMPIA